MTAITYIRENHLRSLKWELNESKNLDGSPLFTVMGTNEKGSPIFFLPIPIDHILLTADNYAIGIKD